MQIKSNRCYQISKLVFNPRFYGFFSNRFHSLRPKIRCQHALHCLILGCTHWERIIVSVKTTQFQLISRVVDAFAAPNTFIFEKAQLAEWLKARKSEKPDAQFFNSEVVFSDVLKLMRSCFKMNALWTAFCNLLICDEIRRSKISSRLHCEENSRWKFHF